MLWSKIRVNAHGCICSYYTSLKVEPGDELVVETKYGLMLCKVSEIIEQIKVNPFEDSKYKAKKHVIENVTKKIYKEEPIMFGNKVVEVKHVSSNRRGLFYTDIEVEVGTFVVYEDNSEDQNMHVGIVTKVDTDCVTADRWIVDTVDTTKHIKRRERIKQAEKLRVQLEAKKKQFQDIELLRLIAANDPETKEMLDKYLSLVNQ